MSTQLSFPALQIPVSDHFPDPRHHPIREYIKQLQAQVEVPIQWDARSGRALDRWLKSNPYVTVEQAHKFIENKFASDDEPRGDPPYYWIPKLSKYAEGPLDRFGRLWRPDWRAGYEGIRR